MSTKISYREQWIRVLGADLGLLFLAMVLGVGSLFIAEWLPILFCWGMILLFSAIPIILGGILSNSPLPELDDVPHSLPWGILGAVVAFVGYAIIPSRYSDPSEQMFDLMCCGIGMAGIVFILCYVMRRSSLFLLTTFIAPVLWGQLLEDEILAIVFTISSIVVVSVLLIVWNRVDPPKKVLRNNHGGPQRIEDILAETEHLLNGDSVEIEEIKEIEWLTFAEEMAQQDDLDNNDEQFDQFVEDIRGDSASPPYIWTVILLVFILFVSLALILVMLL